MIDLSALHSFKEKQYNDESLFYMNFTSETQLGHYKILSPLGAGGMGEVFLAEDTRLDRKVAVKFLSGEFGKDTDKLNRFVQEAKAASALNHPNIITVYEIGEANGVNFIATEFIDGKTLRERMREHLTFDEILSIVIQSAEALSAAHAAGIVHRDIKPENIMIRPDGYVKVLDFGLAKLTEQHHAEAESEDATIKLVKTNPGVVMGTVNYMSPEQARGKDIDARTDIFSFGIVLYEMIAGKLPFAGETMTDVLAAILNAEPEPLKNHAPDTPQELQRIVGKTLKKKRDQRYHSTRDLLGDLKELRDELRLETKLDRTAAPNRPETNQQGQTQFSASSSSSGGGLKDTLLITDFENTTGEAIFDQVLKTALTFALAQSPFLDILTDAKLVQTLRLMGYSPNERVDKKLAYEICLRNGLKAYLTGTISSFGTVYILTLEAVKARTGEILARHYEQAASREEILNALSRAAGGLREQLGESLSSIEKYFVLIDTTTSSLEALEFFTLGTEQKRMGKTLEAVPFFNKALEHDPEFAAAYVALAVTYVNSNQRRLAEEMITKAYELLEKTGELEKLYITYFYYIFATGEIDKAINTLELWRSSYPLTPVPVANLADLLERTGQFEKSVVAARQCLEFEDKAFVSYINLATPLLKLGRFAEAKEVCEAAFENRFDAYYFHILLYQIAFIENDAAMAKHLGWFSGRDNEYFALDVQTAAAAFRGQWRKAQDFSRRAIDLANRRDARESAAQYAAEQALRIAFWSSGAGLPSGEDKRLKTVLKTQTNNALKFERSNKVIPLVALALAAGGQTDEAKSLAAQLETSRPKDTLINELRLPIIRAAHFLQTGKAREAVEELEVAERYEKAGEFYPQYIRALAYLKLNKTKDAVREFDKILNHRGEAPLSSIYPLAQLGKARAMKDKSEYEKFFDLWKDADQDMPALVAAKKEYENLGREPR